MSNDGYAYFPGGENPLKFRDVMTEEGTAGGMTGPQTLGYSTDLTDLVLPIESLDQHDIAKHPAVDTPSGLDHANPRGMIATEGKLAVPEEHVGLTKIADVIAEIMARNLSKIVVRQETPGSGLHRTIALTTTDAVRIATEDDNRARLLIWSTTGNVIIASTIGDVLVGNGATIVPGVGMIELNHHNDVYAIASGGAATVAYVIERWERNG